MNTFIHLMDLPNLFLKSNYIKVTVYGLCSVGRHGPVATDVIKFYCLELVESEYGEMQTLNE